MNVQPAASLPLKALGNQSGQLVIVNLQRTPYDHLSSIRVFAKTDEFMALLMTELGYTDFDREFDCLPQWTPKSALKSGGGADDDDDDDDDDGDSSRRSLLQWTAVALVSFLVLAAAVWWRYPAHW